jgi:hypothetical protein
MTTSTSIFEGNEFELLRQAIERRAEGLPRQAAGVWTLVGGIKTFVIDAGTESGRHSVARLLQKLLAATDRYRSGPIFVSGPFCQGCFRDSNEFGFDGICFVEN